MAKRIWTTLALATLLCTLPAVATTSVYKGIDLLQTQSGAYVDFSNNPLPRNFFGCSEQFAGTIAVVGSPIAASPSVAPADTIIDRLDDVPLAVGSSGSTRVQIAGLCLKKNSWTDPCGNVWKVTVRLDPSRTQPIGNMTIFHSSQTGGTFNSAFSVFGEVLWTDTSSGFTLGPVADDIALSSTGGCWNHTPGTGGKTVNGPVTIDRTCDGSLDTTLPYGTSNFHPGWCPPGPTWTPIPEDGPHPVGGARTTEPCSDIEPVDTGDGATYQPAPRPCPTPVENLE